ncbi:MAG: mechanosensitive ion channel domain-containing protein [Actinomycetes bacterium]
MSAFWLRSAIAGSAILIAAALARVIDARMSRRELAPGTVTRYLVLRRAVFSTIVFVGVISALLVIPEVRLLAGGILASSAVLGLVLGFAAQRTIGNFIAGLLIAFSQPVRLGDEIEVDGTRGVVEEIGLTYTWVRTRNNERLVIPNEKLASETIRNSTIRSARSLAEVTVRVPLSTDLTGLVTALGEGASSAYATELGEDAEITVRGWVANEHDVDRAESDLRLAIHEKLRELGIIRAAE